MQIYLARNQVQAGPYTLEQLNAMLANQQVDLNDLMWHEGMTQWQRVGTMTGEERHYMPSAVYLTHGAANAVSDTGQTSDSTHNRTTVADLYGNKASNSSSHTNKTTSSDKHAFTRNTEYQPPRKSSAVVKTTDNVLASASSRVLATILNVFLISLSTLPISSAFSEQEAYELLENYKLVDTTAEQYALFMDMYAKVPQHLVIMSAILMAALLFVQAILLVKKGQSIGKLITGVRILDKQTQTIPSATIVLLRVALTSFLYYLTPFGLFVAVIDFIAMIINKDRQSIHDKLAKTIVAKADSKQLKAEEPTNRS